MTRETKTERGHERGHMSGRESGSTAHQPWATPAKRNGIAIVSTRNELMESDIVTGQAERKRRDTERGGTERRKRDAISPLAVAVAEGDTTARRVTAIGGTNTRRARGPRRAKKPARIWVQTRRTRRQWSSVHLL